MKKIFVFLTLVLVSISIHAQTNLVAGWDGGDDTSSPSNFGWTSSADRTLQPRNNNGGIRMTTTYSGYKLENGTAYSYSETSDLSSVIFWLRYNTAGESFTYTFQGLEPDAYYDFSALIGWHNNSSNPTFTVKVNDGSTDLATITKAVSAKQTLYSVSARFKTSSTITNTTDIKLVFTCSQTGDCMEAISAMNLVSVVKGQTLPTFSTDSHETWYYIQFKNGNAVLQDMGEWKAAQTATLSLTDSSQLWKLVGTKDNCEIVGRSGRHLYYNGSRFATDDGISKRGEMKLISTTNSSYAPAWEIQASNTGGNSMNQWGGAGAGKELGAWNAGDNNNPLNFVDASTIETREWAKTAFDMVKTWNKRMGLVKDASKFTSNAKDPSEGSYEALIDGDYTTYFHSTWHGDNDPGEDHYLQAEIEEPVNAFYFYFMKCSQNNNNRPTEIDISAGDDEVFGLDLVASITKGLPTDASDVDFVSQPIALPAAYKYIRFTVPSTNNSAKNGDHVFFSFSEFNLFPVTPEVKEVLESGYMTITSYEDLTNEDVAAIFALDAKIPGSDAQIWEDSDSLIVNVSQFSSPYSDPEEGNFYSLIDRLYECPENQHPDDDFWHSNWHNGSVTPGTHYFQVEMLEPEALSDEIVFVFTRRPTENDHTTEWSVRGTNNPNADKTDCEELAYIFTPYGNNTETLVSDAFNPKGYKYLRFYSQAQTGVNYGPRGYFHLSRFQLYSLKSLPRATFSVTAVGGGRIVYENEVVRDNMKSNSVVLGKEVTLTITPDEGYAVESVIVNGTQDVTDQLVDGQLTLMVNAETTVAVKFELSDFTKLGDVNNDGVITVGDVVLTVNHLIGHSSSKFVLRQADANNDGEVNVGDIDRIIEFITGQKERGYHAPALRMPVITECDDVIMGSVVANGVTIGLQNTTEYSAYQMALTLPDGVAPDDVIVNLSRTADHAFARGVLPDGRLMLVVYSMSRTPFTGTDGPLLNIVLPDGASHALVADDITFVTRQGEVRKFSVLSLDAEEIDGVSNIERQMPNGAGAVYDLSGRRMKSSIFNLPSSILKKGIYIINGKKIIVR